MSDKPNLPLGDIAGYDQGKLKKTEVADKSGVSAHDKLLATVAGGQVNLKVNVDRKTDKRIVGPWVEVGTKHLRDLTRCAVRVDVYHFLLNS